MTKITMNSLNAARLRRMGAAALLLSLSGGCGLITPKKTEQPTFYSLDTAATKQVRAATPLPAAAPTLIVNPAHAAAGFDSKRIIYVRQDHNLEYFAHSQWADTPARMIAPLIVTAVESTGSFRAVVVTPSAATGDLRLDTEIVRLQQDFGSQPSGVRLTLRAYVMDNTTRRVLAWREFDETAPAASEDPYGGVIAANRAVQMVLAKLAAFCADTAAGWQPPVRR
jgi:cholesterol transport system auxiliary component